MFLVIYEYVGQEDRGDYHMNCDWEVFYHEDDLKMALLLFWNRKEGGHYHRRSEHKKDFIIKNVLCVEKEIDDFINEYWKNEPEYQE